MINKVYDKFIKNNIKFIIIYILIFTYSVVPLPYYIDMPGGTTNINEKIEVENGYKSKGEFGFAYVSSLRATPLFYTISLFNKNWEVVSISDLKLDNETLKETNYRDNILMEESFDNASVVAFAKANKKLEITENKLFVTYVDKLSNSNLKVKDQIISVDNIKVNSLQEIKDIIKDNETLDIEYKRNDKIYNEKIKLIDTKGIKTIGIMLSNNLEFKSTPSIKFKKDANESGPSGGLMLSLAIYNNLVKEDITKGKKIIGTGTIDINGNVGEIGGIKYKIKGAIKDDADIFFVPEENYEEALSTLKTKDNKIKLVKVKTFDDALNYLKTL